MSKHIAPSLSLCKRFAQYAPQSAPSGGLFLLAVGASHLGVRAVRNGGVLNARASAFGRTCGQNASFTLSLTALIPVAVGEGGAVLSTRSTTRLSLCGIGVSFVVFVFISAIHLFLLYE